MKYKSLTIAAFVVVCLAQLYAPVSMILHREEVLQHGKEYKFETAPIDPNDPFRGKYIVLRFREESFPVDSTENWDQAEDIFLHLQTDRNGFATIRSISQVPPAENTDYVKAKVSYVSHHNGRDSIFFEYPFNRFYMKESKAYEAELAYQSSQQDTTQQTFALVRVKDGEAVLKDVLINGVPVKEVVERQRERDQAAIKKAQEQ
ncbi:GDYXXLXY domain-containing protein [Pontibacter beigongshangensis]|uniref:GDYXXLXY domain-containing protein n=1 Tax=Pontibacter beigongshangensis TaxID=2574733 RepID=UPI0016503911|nr:GDYXXLXY domain-containing protein [Pontibacter beigongshangensis]